MAELLFIAVLLTLLAISVGVGILLSLGLAGSLFTDAPFVPSARHSIREAEQLLKLREGSVLYDLGCGNGRAAYYFADMHRGARVVGYDIAPLPLLLARVISLVKPRANAVIQFGSIDTAPISDATHIYLYLFPEAIQRLEDRIARDTKPGTRVVVCDFPFPTKAPDETVTVGTGFRRHTLYAYTF